MVYFLISLMGYLLGCSNMALYISKWKNVDIRSHGSGNPGASNAAIVLGWKAGILTGLHDVLKAWLTVILTKLLLPDLPFGALVAGSACVLGHIFPVFMKWKGGKGFGPYIGLILGLDWRLALVLMVLVAVVTVITDYIVAGTALTILTAPIYLSIRQQSLLPLLILGCVSAVMVYKHWENLLRILKGTEIGLRATAKGKHRQK